MSRARRFISALFCVSSCCAQSLTYRVDAGFVGNASRQGKKPGELIVLTLPGREFKPPIQIAPLDRAAVDRSTPEGTLRSMRSANMAGDIDWIASNFAPQDQARLRKEFEVPGGLQKSRDYYATLIDVQALETVRIRQYTIMVVREASANRAVINPVTMIKTPDGWKATNDLAADPTLDVVWMALRTREPSTH